MWWMAGASGALGLVSGFFGASSSNKLASINERLSSGLAKDANTVRSARNEEMAATNSLNRWVQSVNNSRALKAGGETKEASDRNFYRQSDAWAYNSVSEGIAKAEQAGASAAGSAAAGVEGSVVDMVNTSTRLRSAIVDQRTRDVQGLVRSDADRRAGQIMSQTIQGLNTSLILDNLDYSTDVGRSYTKQSTLGAGVMGAVGAVARQLPGILSSQVGGQSPTPTTNRYSSLDVPGYSARNSDLSFTGGNPWTNQGESALAVTGGNFFNFKADESWKSFGIGTTGLFSR